MAARTSAEIRAEVEARFGFFPSFFEPAVRTPAVLESLWQQTLAAYIDNPIPALFKEKLAASIARFCTQPYCLLSHSSSLHPLGMTASAIFELLQEEPLDDEQLTLRTQKLKEITLAEWPESGSEIEVGIYHCCLAIFLNQATEESRSRLRHVLPPSLYDHLNLFLSYNKTCLSWAEAHPELDYQTDRRVRDHYEALVSEDPRLLEFFTNYRGRVIEQTARRSEWLTQGNKLLISELRLSQKSLASDRDNLLQLFEVSPTPTVLWRSRDLIFDRVSPIYQNHFPGRILIGKSFLEALPEERYLQFYDVLIGVFDSGVPVTMNEQLVQFGVDGAGLQDRWFTLSFIQIKDGQGHPYGVYQQAIDITEQVLARKKIANEKRKTDTLIAESSSAISLMVGPDLIFEVANAKWAELASPREFIGHSYATVYPELVDSPGHQSFRYTFETGEPYVGKELKLKVNSRDGNFEDQYFDFTNIRVNDSNGLPYGVYCHAANVTERVRARQVLEENQNRLRKSEERLSATIEVAKVGFYEWDILNDLVLFSPQMQEDWKIGEYGPLSAALSKIDIRDRSRVENLITDAMATRKDFRAEYRVVHPDGRIVWIEARGKLTVNGEGIADRFIGTSLNVTDRRKAEDELAFERQKLETIFEDSPAAMSLWKGPDFIFEKVNPQYQALFGDRRLKSLPLLEALPELKGQGFVEMLQSVLTTGVPVVGKDVLAKIQTSKNGPIEDRYFDFSYLQINDPEGNPYGVYDHAVDVTDRILSQRELVIAKVAAENANQVKSAFLANMSHEIRTPLAAILGFTDLLKDARLTSDEREYLDVISRNGTALSHVIDDILDLSKVEAGQMKIESVPFDLRALAKEVVTLFSDIARSKELDLKFESNVAKNLLILSDPTRVRQVLVNLIGNAIKFTAHGQVCVSLRATSLELAEPRFEFRVHDTGRGISREQASKLFHAFVQADESTTRQFGGTGLGLALSRRLANALGGDVEIESSALNEGSTFLFAFHATTIKKSDHEEIDFVKPRSLEKRKALNNCSLLVVDDSPDNRVLMQIFLKKAGAKVEEAASGEEAIAKALANHYDVVLMDIQMPGMDGYGALKSLRARGYAQPVIALTAHAMVEEKRRTLAAGFADHVTKPVDPDALIGAILGQNKSGNRS